MVFEGDSGVETGENSTPPEEDSGIPPSGTAAAQAALDEAMRAYQAADEALKAGNLAEYQRQIDNARKQVEAAQRALR